MGRILNRCARSLNRLKGLILEEVWEEEPSRLTRPRRLLYSLLRLIYLIGHGFVAHLVRLQALALAFKLLLSIAPFLAVAFSLLKAFGVHNRLRPVLSELLAPLGPQGEEITGRLIEFVNNVHVGALGTIGLMTLLVTVMSLMGDIERAFNQIWGVTRARGLSRRFSDYLSVLLVGPVLVFSALGVTASLQSSALVQRLVAIEPFGTLIVSLLRLLPYLALWGAFTFLYVFIPNTRVKVSSALIGGLVAALLWESAGWGFAVFVASAAKKYYAIYSSFAILLLFLIWLYVGWVIVLFGAEVAFAHQNLRVYGRERKGATTGAAAREMIALSAMVLIGQNFYWGRPPWKVDELAGELRVSPGLIAELVDLLQRNQLLVGTDGRGYVPARDLEQIGVKQIVDAVRGHVAPLVEKGKEPDVVAQVFQEIDLSLAAALKGKNLKGLVLS